MKALEVFLPNKTLNKNTQELDSTVHVENCKSGNEVGMVPKHIRAKLWAL